MSRPVCGPVQSLDFNPFNTNRINWNTDCGPSLLAWHQCMTSINARQIPTVLIQNLVKRFGRRVEIIITAKGYIKSWRFTRMALKILTWVWNTEDNGRMAKDSHIPNYIITTLFSQQNEVFVPNNAISDMLPQFF